MRTPALTSRRRGLIAALLVAWVAAAPLLASQAKWKWWQSEQIQAELGLTTDQVTRLEDVFRTSLPALKEQKRDLDRLETELSALIAGTGATEASVLQLIDRVEASRSALGRTRSLMLFRLHQVLMPEQRVKLKELHERGESGPPRHGGPPR